VLTVRTKPPKTLRGHGSVARWSDRTLNRFVHSPTASVRVAIRNHDATRTSAKALRMS
jgi:hypothetical protein